MWAEGAIILDEYEVVRELGSGGMATAYLVRHIDRGKLLAVKVPYRHLVESAEDRMIFANEVQMWIGLPQHPHIVQCYFVREVEGTPVVFAEYVPSGTLASWTTRGRIHGLPHVLDLGIQLAEAMGVAQRLGVVHRDLKPANCLMDDAGLLKVGDFGVASARAKTAERREKPTSSSAQPRRLTAGTLAYCSPEQYDGRPEDSRTDIWSFGITLFEILTQNRPGLGPVAPHAIRQYRVSHPDSAIPGEIWDFLLSVLEPNLSQRPDSFVHVSKQLQQLYGAVTGRAYSRQFPEPTKAPDEQVSTPGARSRVALGYLRRALKFDGREAAEAEQFDVAVPGGQRTEEADLLAAVSILNEATRIYRQTPTAKAPDDRMMELAAVLQATAETQRRLGNLAAAVAAYGEAATHLQTLFRHRRTPHVALNLVAVIQDRAVCQRQSGNLAQAIADYEKGIAALTKLDLSKFDPSLTNMLANLHQNRAMALFKAQRLTEAVAEAGRSIELRERLVGELGKLEYAVDLAGSYCNRGVLHRNMGNTRGAMDDYTHAVELCERPGARGLLNRKDEILSMVFLNRSAVRLAENDYRGAAKDAGEAVEIMERLAKDSAKPEQLLNLSLAYNNRSEAHEHLGDRVRAQADVDRCIQLREQLVDQWGMVNLAGTLARAYHNKVLHQIEMGDFSRALPLVERAVASFESHVHRKGRADLLLELARLRVLRGVVRSGTRQPQQGVADLAAAIHELESLLPTGAADVYDALTQALLFCVMAHLGLTVAFDAPTPQDPSAWEQTWSQGTPQQRPKVLSLIRSALLKTRDAAVQSRTFPTYLAPRLHALGTMLAPAARLASNRPDAPDIASVIRDILQHAR